MGYVAQCSLAGTKHADGVCEDMVFFHNDRVLCVADGMSEGRGRITPAEIRSQIELALLPALDQVSGMWEWADHDRLMRTLSEFIPKLNGHMISIGAKASITLAVRGKPGSPCVYVYSLGDVACYLAGAGLLSWTPANFPEAAREEQRSGSGAVQRYIGMPNLPDVKSCCALIASPNYCNAKVIRWFALNHRFYLLDQGSTLVAASDGVWGAFADPGRFREELARAIASAPSVVEATNSFTERIRQSDASGGDDCSLAFWVIGEEGDFLRPIIDDTVHRGISRFCTLARRAPTVADASTAYAERIRRAASRADAGRELEPAWQLYDGARHETAAVQDVALMTASLVGTILVQTEELSEANAAAMEAAGAAAQQQEHEKQAIHSLEEKASDLDVALKILKIMSRELPIESAQPKTQAGIDLARRLHKLALLYREAKGAGERTAALEQKLGQSDARLSKAQMALQSLRTQLQQAETEPLPSEAKDEGGLLDQFPIPRRRVRRTRRWPLVVSVACAALFLALAAYFDMANRKMTAQLKQIPEAITKITEAHPDRLAEVKVTIENKGAKAALTALVDKMKTVKTDWENADETRKEMVGKIKRLEDDKKKHEAVLRYIGGDKNALDGLEKDDWSATLQKIMEKAEKLEVLVERYKDVPPDEWLLIWHDQDGGLKVKDSGEVPEPKKAALDKLRATVRWVNAINAGKGPDNCAVLWIDGQKTMRQKLGKNVKTGDDLARRVEWAAAMSGAAGPDAVWQQLTASLQKAGDQAVQRLVSEARYKKGQPWDLGKALGVYQEEIAEHAKKQPHDDSVLLWSDDQKKFQTTVGEKVATESDLLRRVRWAEAMKDGWPDKAWGTLKTLVGEGKQDQLKDKADYANGPNAATWNLEGALELVGKQMGELRKSLDAPTPHRPPGGAPPKRTQRDASPPYLMAPEKVQALWLEATGEEKLQGTDWEEKRSFFWYGVAKFIDGKYSVQAMNTRNSEALKEWATRVYGTLEQKLTKKDGIEDLFYPFAAAEEARDGGE